MDKSLHTLPRETRDTYVILSVVAVILLPQATSLPLWASALATLLLAWRFWIARNAQSLPNKWLLAALLALVITATVLQFQSIVGPQAGVVLIVLLLALKTLEMRARRDAMVIFFLGFFTLLTLFFDSQSLSMAAAMLLAVWGLLTALVNAHMPAGYPSVRLLLRTSGTLMLLGTPIMLMLFLSFPRFAPLWGLPSQSPQGRTGLANDMTVGQVAELAQDHSVALRVRFDTPNHQPPPQQLLYFRGPVLSYFDGRRWQAHTESGAATLAPDSAIPVSNHGEPLGYEVTLEPHQQRWLLTLDATPTQPQTVFHRLMPTADLQWLSPRPITEVLRYQGQAQLHFTYGQQLSSHQKNLHLQLPAGLNPQTLAWAQALRTTHGSNDQALINAVLTRLADGSFVYTLQPGTTHSIHTADEFWFDHQQGFCEHIASAFAILMRAAGIPVRIVTGYQGGERNTVDGLWTVRHSDAHAWTEVWLPAKGWVRIDPTSAVAPARTELLQRLASEPAMLAASIGHVLSPHVLHQFRANWEAINHRWNNWVLNYARSNQDQMLRHLGLDRWNAAKAALWLGALIALTLTALGLQRWYKQRIPDPWLRLMHLARHRLAQAGIAHAYTLGNQALARAVQAQWGNDASQLQKWLQQMEQWRYAPHHAHTPSLSTLRREYRALIWPRSRTP